MNKMLITVKTKANTIIIEPSRSNEYINLPAIVFNKENRIDITSKEGLEKHVTRNKYQFHMAPHNLETMYKFVKNGWFVYEGYSPCHNVPTLGDTEKIRRYLCKITPKLFLSGQIYKMNPFSELGNISFRGSPNSPFEGCQFVYNNFTKKLVTDNVNKGTWDFGKYGTLSHLLLDVNPWLSIGNGNINESENDFILPKSKENIFLNSTFNNKNSNLPQKIFLEDGSIINLSNYIKKLA